MIRVSLVSLFISGSALAQAVILAAGSQEQILTGTEVTHSLA